MLILNQLLANVAPIVGATIKSVFILICAIYVTAIEVYLELWLTVYLGLKDS